MITLIIGIIILLYSFYNLLYIEKFIHKLHGASLDYTIDAIIIVLVCIWFVIEFFLKPGPIALIPLIFGLINPNHTSYWKTKLLHRLIVFSVIITTTFIILNELYFNFNFWITCI